MLGGFFVVLGGIVFVIMKTVRDTNRAGFSVKPVPAQ
jgi:hypothetical protein